MRTLLCVFIQILSFHALAQGPPIAKRLAIIFRGPTICDGCGESWASLLEDRNFEVVYVGPGGATPRLLQKAQVFVVPGGEDVTQVVDGLSKKDRLAVRDFVKKGGTYLGACLGAYWAADWDGDADGFVPLNIVPAHVRAHDRDPRDKVVRVDWQGKTRWVYFQDGPSFKLTSERNVEVYSRYEDGSVAAFGSNYGKGRVLLTGIHVEADQDWYDMHKLSDPDGPDLDLAYQLIDSV